MTDQPSSRLHIVGVRHHSPACARLVEATIRAVEPVAVLVEGPSDLNGRLPELLLEHRLPIALYSFLHAEDDTGATVTRKSSWYPLCAYSPEFVALKTGSELGAELRFMDLPAWHEAFSDVENLSADRVDRYGDAIDLLCERTGTNNMDSLWDHLFEGVADTAILAEALDTYFEEIRQLSPLNARDAAREDHMRANISAAMHRYPRGNIVVVCGGFHAPALTIADPTGPTGRTGQTGRTTNSLEWPEPPLAVGSTAETYLVPYSYHRLDAFTGYQSGMPSPSYYEALYYDGPELAASRMLQLVAARLRAMKQTVSTADLVAAQTLTEALARLRSHPTPLRSDLLDGLGGALMKDAREQPYPWDVREPISVRTHPLLLELIATFSGDRRGRLAPDTPLPPLVADVQEQLEACALAITVAPRTSVLDLTKPRDLRCSYTLHRLRVLQVPGFHRLGEGLSIDEHWTITDDLDAAAHLIEASIYGPSLEQAATAALRERLSQIEPTSAPLIDVLTAAVLCRLTDLDREAIEAARSAIGLDSSLRSVGLTLTALASLLGADELFRQTGTSDSLEPQLLELVEQAVERFIWLLEQLTGASSSDDVPHVEAIISLGAALRLLKADRAPVAGVLRRKAVDPSTPPAVRGASLGALWSLDLLDQDAVDAAVQGFRSIAASAGPGDFLLGLFATARLLVVQDDVLLKELDGFIERLTPDEFLTLVPSLRAAFAWFTPRERRQLGEHLARLRGLTPATNIADRLYDDPLNIAHAMAFEEALLNTLRTYGLAGSR
jgi:Family of unknown function (DUF5682)